MSDITPGIWTVHAEEPDGDGAEVWAVQENGGRRHVASHLGDDDAVLIAAAPELLSALRGLLDWCREHTGPTMPNSPYELLCVAHNAIAKAEGAGQQ